MCQKRCSGCAHEAFDPIGVCGTDKPAYPSGEMACCLCIRNPKQEEFYKMVKEWHKWWEIRARIWIWRNFRPSKCKDMYITLKESLKK